MHQPPRQAGADRQGRHRIGGGALLQFGEKALRTVFGGFLGLGDQFVLGVARLGPRIVLETRQGAWRTQARQVIGKSGSCLLDVAFERVQFSVTHRLPRPGSLLAREMSGLRAVSRFAPTPERLWLAP